MMKDRVTKCKLAQISRLENFKSFFTPLDRPKTKIKMNGNIGKK